MRLSEMQAELKEMGVAYRDCFDRESLTERLKDAREGKIQPTKEAVPKEVEPTVQESTVQEPVAEKEPEAKQGPAPSSSFDREATLAELRSMRAKELKAECGRRNIRWAGMFEKEELVQALIGVMEATSNFSSSGAITPGKVAELTADDLEAELSNPSNTPLILDVYAVWCGPCKMMAPQLVEAAEELGDTVRVAKIDSDKFPDWSRKLKIGAFPTVVVFNGDGSEAQRVEGALMKDQLVQLVQSHIKSS